MDTQKTQPARDTQKRHPLTLHQLHHLHFVQQLILTVSLATSLLLAGCGTTTAIVQSAAPSYKTVPMKGDPKTHPKSSHEYVFGAAPFWEFHCKPEYSFDVVEKTDFGKTALVTIKIKKVTVPLSLDLVDWLPAKPSEEAIAHEKGHHLVCQSVYKEAPDVVKEASALVIDKQFQGEGSTQEEACQNAIALADERIRNMFLEKIVSKATDLNVEYDRFALDKQTKHEKMSAEKLVEEMFKDLKKRQQIL